MTDSDWQPRISAERAEILIYLFGLIKENPDAFLNTDLVPPRSRADFLDVMHWFEKAYDRRKMLEAFEQEWGTK